MERRRRELTLEGREIAGMPIYPSFSELPPDLLSAACIQTRIGLGRGRRRATLKDVSARNLVDPRAKAETSSCSNFIGRLEIR